MTPTTRGGRRVAPAGGAELVADKVLANGDVYRGGFSGGVPHGLGRYVWADGCVYDGEWCRGSASGRGRFTWPSGATFDGEFRGGRMEGRGVFVGPEGDAYSGGWRGDRRHGRGAKRYTNGDVYDGQWSRGLQEGYGSYVWGSGNQYVGEWRAGVISGRGALIWSNGCRFDGLWENGVPKGTGVVTWPDGSRYVGAWPVRCSETKAVAGTLFPAAAARGSTGEKVAAFQQICIWESDGDAGDITCDIVGALEAPPVSCDEQVEEQSWPAPCWVMPRLATVPGGERPRPGQTVDKWHKNHELVRNLQLGISYSVGKSAAMSTQALASSDFDPHEKFWTRFPPEGSKVTPPHTSAEFRWKDYCPAVFRHLRKLFAVDPADYMLAICGDNALRELSSPGKSGSFFYLTQDDRFMIKTVKKSEVKVLIRMLPNYYIHVSQCANSLLTKFYGVHCVKPIGGTKVRFVVMGNLLCSDHWIHRRFDLKGSSYGRTTDMFEEEIDEITTLKDLDLNFLFRLPRCWHNELHQQLRRDCEFLEAEGIMDYSFLVGVHFCDDISATKFMSSPAVASPKFPGKRKHILGGSPEFCFADQDTNDLISPDRKTSVRMGYNVPARAEQVLRSECGQFPMSGNEFTKPHHHGGCMIYNVVLYFGIIDILQDYGISKKLERAYKSLQTDPNSISAVDPLQYSSRFQDFIGRIFIEDG